MARMFAMAAAGLAVVLGTGGAAMALPAYDSLVVFGDSLSDTGNICAFAPAYCPPSPPYAAGRFSNGPVAVEDLAHKLGLPLGPAAFGGTDFAFGGARADNSVVPDSVTPPTLPQQALLYLTGTGGRSDPNALYVVFGGTNDVQVALENPLDAPAVLAAAVNGIFNTVGDLLLTGARHVLLADIPNLGLTPYAAALAISQNDPTIPGTATAEAAFVNDHLFGFFKLSRAHGFDISYLDAFALETAAVANPAAFGLTNATTPCFNGVTVCANPDRYLFWDALHPTARAHALLADAAAAALPEPAGIGLLGLGLAALGWTRRRDRISGQPANSASISRR